MDLVTIAAAYQSPESYFWNETAELDKGTDGEIFTTDFPNNSAMGLKGQRKEVSQLFQYRIIPSLFLVLCVVGIFGNGIVIKVLWSIMSKSTMKSVTDILVINLAIADFIFVGSLPFWATERYMENRWLFGTVGCKLMSFITLLNLYGSVFFLVAMGIDRYLAVVYAVRARNYRTPRNAIVACAVIWALASLIGMQALLWRKVMRLGSKDRCMWELPENYTTVYYVIRMTFGFFVPFFVIVYCYILIILKLHRRANSSRLTGSSMTNKQQKITRAILAVISLFVVCWLPNHIVTLILAVTMNDKVIRNAIDFTTANNVAMCMAYANSSINPILYAFMKDEIRQKGTAMIVKFFTCCKRSTQKGTRSINKTSKERTRKFSFWRSTRHTMLAVLPRHSANIEVDGIEAQNGNDIKSVRYSPNDDVRKSMESLRLPTTPNETNMNGSPTDDSQDYGKVGLMVSLNE